MEISELSGRRLKTALKRFQQGKQTSYWGLGLRLNDDGHLEFTMFPRIDDEELTEEKAFHFFGKSRENLEKILRLCPELSDIVRERNVIFQLVRPSGGISCKLIYNQLVWAKGFPKGSNL